LTVTSLGLRVFMTKSDTYRANALDCMKLAAAIGDATTKLLFVQMADAWLRLADHVELAKPYQPADGVSERELNRGPDPEPET
jgi:hypothetical protein